MRVEQELRRGETSSVQYLGIALEGTLINVGSCYTTNFCKGLHNVYIWYCNKSMNIIESTEIHISQKDMPFKICISEYVFSQQVYY